VSAAPLSRRLAAKLVDGMVLAPPLYLSAAALGVGPLGSAGTSAAVLFAGIVLPLAVLAYQGSLLMEVSQSLGKRVFGIEVVARGGGPLDGIRVAMRVWLPLGIVLVPPAMNLLNGPGFYPARWMADGWTFSGAAVALDALSVLRADGRCLHDQLAGTQVVVAAAPGPGSPPRPAVDHGRLVLRALALTVVPVLGLAAIGVVVVILYVIVMIFRFLGHMG
jgi:uncharacterized RDD family membrane protein YckC